MAQGFGAYGKIPAVGDFFRLSPPNGFVRVWDAWLQEILSEAQAAYGADFDAHYMSAPIWRFTLPRGVAGAGKVMGVLMPSVDRVGRRFPLTLVQAVSTSGPASADHMGANAVFEKLEDLALMALDDNTTLELLGEGLADIPHLALPDVPPVRGSGGNIVVTGIAAGDSLARILAGQLMAKSMPEAAIWSAVLDGVPRMLACPGLPRGPMATALFDMHAPIWREAPPL
ncbi:type VI secretion system-associated protein TagF [Epibacterium ulvae]|uniref:type VI secretion system-associated protein TagF n=1 Tax=Epibacterium ulvae TaxID=1156985 RepID=UPI001BFC909A|nr:type VI secretion system-associated protein TagF [Epibacterium ulvae]MBT8155481.1 type VI secretion system-associated protein TagF [Epibacterium ulvae]